MSTQHRPSGTKPRHGVTFDHQSNDSASHAARRLSPQRIEANGVDVGSKRAVAIKACFEGGVCSSHIVAVAEEPSLDALNEIRTARPDAVGRATLDQGVVELNPNVGIVDIDFKTALRAPTGPGDNERMPAKCKDAKAEESNRPYLFPEHCGDHILSAGTLHRKRPDVGLANAHIETQPVGQSTGPKHHVGIGNGEPKAVFRHPQQNRIVDQQTIVVTNRRVGTPANPDLA